MTLLAARGLSKRFGGVAAVAGVDLDIGPSGSHALIGPNGAGKTTLVSLVSGRITPSGGTIHLDGRDITSMPAHRRVRAGIAYTFQITSIYPALTTFENAALAVQRRRGGGKGLAGATIAALDRTGLADLADAPAGSLTYGHQRLLELAMGLALAPRLLILDEPTQGLAEDGIAAILPLIRDTAVDTSVLLIEHNMEVVMALADRVSVLVEGRILAQGPPAEIRADPVVQEAYLGS